MLQSWPQNELEYIGCCPVCDSKERSILHNNLQDKIFYCRPGNWTMWRCEKCGSSYLDPRPTVESIGIAYEGYYTHQSLPDSKDAYASLSLLRKIRRRLVNGYTNWRYSTREIPASPLGILILFALRKYRVQLDREYRHLPRCPASGGVLLDVGSGSGFFLLIAKSCGWTAIGVDPDPKVVANGRAQGLKVVQGGIEQFDGQKSMFDVITLSHAIEHVHKPVDTLRACYHLLKPGGRLWLETPNIGSLGHRRYGGDWRGLEPPRHLVLFNVASIGNVLRRIGFTGIKQLTRPSPLHFMTRENEAIRRELMRYQCIDLTWEKKCSIHMDEWIEHLFPSTRELLTFGANKPV